MKVGKKFFYQQIFFLFQVNVKEIVFDKAKQVTNCIISTSFASYKKPRETDQKKWSEFENS